VTEQRQHRRFEVRLSCELSVDGRTVHAETDNVSSGGVGLQSSRPLPEGDKIRAILFLTHDGIESPDHPPLDAELHIVWVAARDDGQHTAGARFTSLTPAQTTLLGRFLAELA
jgi:hypothetical protein